MAPRKNEESTTEVTQAPEESPQGVQSTSPAEPVQIDGAVNLAAVAPEHESVAGGRTDGPILVADPPAEADKTSYPGPGDAKPEDPPVRTTRPDVPIVVSSATGAGQHVPPDPALYDWDGRPRSRPGNE